MNRYLLQRISGPLILRPQPPEVLVQDHRFCTENVLCGESGACAIRSLSSWYTESTRKKGNGASLVVSHSLRFIRHVLPLRLGLPDRQSRETQQVWVVGRQVGQAEDMHHGDHKRIVREQPILSTMLLRGWQMPKCDRHHCHVERGDGGGRSPVLHQLCDQRGMLFEVFDGGA